MIRNIREAQSREEGFTLIELLVVVIIIGILAAIAIPSFLNQRERAWQAELTSAARNFALDVEAQATAAGGVYPATAAVQNEADFHYDTDGDGAVNDVLTYIASATGDDFCVIGTDPRVNGGVNHISYQASTGGLQDFSETAVTAANTDCTLDT